jgi:Smg protein
MFDVLAFVYDSYWFGDACPELPTLQRELFSVGFDRDEIRQALIWIEDLKLATSHVPMAPSSPDCVPALVTPAGLPSSAMRMLSQAEQLRLGQQSWGYLTFLYSAGALTPERLELVMDRILAAPEQPISVEHLKLVVLLVFWSLGQEPDALILDELCDTQEGRSPH